MKNEKRKTIKKKLLKIFLAVSAVSLITASIAGVISIIKIHDDDEDVMLSQVKQNIYAEILLNANIASAEMKKYSGYVEDFSRQIHDIYTRTNDYSRIHAPISDNLNNSVYDIQIFLADENVSFDEIPEDVSLLRNIQKVWRNILIDEKDKFAFAYIASKKGFMLVYSNIHYEGIKYYNYLGSLWYRKAFERGSVGFSYGAVFTDIYRDAFQEWDIITCAAPFYDAENNFAGVVGIDIKAGDLYRVLVHQEENEKGAIFIVDGAGKIITSSSGDSVPKTLMDYDDMDDHTLSSILSGNTGISWTKSGMYYVYAPIEQTECKICLRISEDEVLSSDIYIAYEKFTFVLALFSVSFIVIIIMTALASEKFSERFTAPILALSKDVKIISEWNLDHRAEVHDNDEIGDLALSVNEMAMSLKEYMTDFGKVTIEKEQIRAELNVAAQIQADMLPKKFPAFPDRNEFDIYASMTPAKEVGGDFYDFFMIDSNHLAIVIADVSDKGVPAALFMVIAKTLIKNRAKMGGRPSEILSDVNNQLCEGNDAMLFVTVWLGILEISTGHAAASNAGHELPVVMMNGKRFTLMNEENHNPAMAVIPDIEFGDNEFILEPGSIIYLYTDGVAEAMNSDNKLYGTDRMLDTLNTHAEDSPEDILNAMKHDVDAFVKDTPQSDDITMICLKYFGTLRRN